MRHLVRKPRAKLADLPKFAPVWGWLFIGKDVGWWWQRSHYPTSLREYHYRFLTVCSVDASAQSLDATVNELPQPQSC